MYWYFHINEGSEKIASKNHEVSMLDLNTNKSKYHEN